MADRRKCHSIVAINDQARDFVVFIRHYNLIEEGAQRQFGQRHLRDGALFGAGCGNARQRVAGTRRRGLGHQILQVAKTVSLGADCVTVLMRVRSNCVGHDDRIHW